MNFIFNYLQSATSIDNVTVTDPAESIEYVMYTVLQLPDEMMGLSQSFLGVGHFGFIAPVCKRFKTTYLARVSDEMITNMGSIISSISCAQKYLEDTGFCGTPFQDTGVAVVKLELLWFYAARYGSLGVIEWAHQRGYSRLWEEYRLDGEDGFGEDSWVQVGKATCAKAAEYGHLDALQLLRQHGCHWSSRTCRDAAEDGHLAVLQWLRANGCDWDVMTCSSAARGGHLSILQWLRANGCDWNDRMTFMATAGGGHLTVLQLARVNGCEWDSGTCSAAAGGGHLSILQWARENRCPWYSRTCSDAAGGGHLSVLQWARENGCPWCSRTFRCS